MSHYRLGRLGFSLAGSDPLVDHLAAEFQPLRTERVDPLHLSFDFAPALPELRDYVVLSPLLVAPDAYRARHGGVEYQVEGEPPFLRIHLRSVARFAAERVAPGWLLRSVSRNYLLPSEKVAKTFMYNVFDYLTQLANLRLSQSYIHASTFERDGRAVAIAAWGGVGKTTSMLKLVGEAGWRFLSDDLALLDDAGTAWRTPKRMQIYGYNLEGQSELRRSIMAGRSTLDRAAWQVALRTAGPKGVRRRVSAEELFGAERIAVRANLTDVLQMERADVPAIILETIDADEVARRAASTMLRETQPLSDLIAAMYSGARQPILPTHERFHLETRDTLRRCLDGVRTRLVRVPLRATPDDLARRLSQLLDED